MNLQAFEGPQTFEVASSAGGFTLDNLSSGAIMRQTLKHTPGKQIFPLASVSLLLQLAH